MRKTTHKDDKAVLKAVKNYIAGKGVGHRFTLSEIVQLVSDSLGANARRIDVEHAIQTLEYSEGIISTTEGSYLYTLCKPVVLSLLDVWQDDTHRHFSMLDSKDACVISVTLEGLGQRRAEAVFLGELRAKKDCDLFLSTRRSNILRSILCGIQDGRIDGRIFVMWPDKSKIEKAC